MTKAVRTADIIEVTHFSVGTDKTNKRFLVRFFVGKQAMPILSLSAETVAELNAAIVKRLSKLVVMH
jgi:hypothetical protein